MHVCGLGAEFVEVAIFCLQGVEILVALFGQSGSFLVYSTIFCQLLLPTIMLKFLFAFSLLFLAHLLLEPRLGLWLLRFHLKFCFPYLLFWFFRLLTFIFKGGVSLMLARAGILAVLSRFQNRIFLHPFK